jgi:hypothetical protein
MAEEIEKNEPKDTEPHPEFPGLTWGDVRKARNKAAVTREAEKRAEALKRIEEQELEALRAADGESERNRREMENLDPVNRELVDITLNLSPQMCPDSRDPTVGMRIDGVVYRNRHTYTVTRAKAAEMLRIQHLGWEQESERMGQDKNAFYASRAMAGNNIVVNTRSGITGRVPRGTH